ncbi:TPA: hypothetical protein N0F65_007663 [Lagenidium giganteum]|uniref:DUF4954 domain-containing protein n=1 Tax=Lagenidium giganteum TaxID=4803 RepID=A0AAV2ZAI9_9STRA|nr:TPA: hypothetical protein N0F65_007663 [Lagenidium giganteum]
MTRTATKTLGLDSASELLALSAQRQKLFAHSHHALSAEEVNALVQNGNVADDWSAVRKVHAAVPLRTDRVRNCCFEGKVVLGRFERDQIIEGVRFRSGCYNSTLSNTVVLDNAIVKDTMVLHNVLIEADAAVIASGSVVCKGETAYGNGRTLSVGVEIGGRDIPVFAELTFAVARSIACDRKDTQHLQAFKDAVVEYTKKVTSSFTVVGKGARLVRCARFENSLLGEHGVVEDSQVINCTILSSSDEVSRVSGNSFVTDSILQWKSVVEMLSVVERSFLCDIAHVERHGIVMSSFIGPNTSIAEGEVTSCFVGPFVGFHHHALLIASLWPEGKGNVGYGANVGSNHTLKAPDQELLPGEGVFFGLGSNIKFPSNFTKSPYSVIATAVSTLPQQVDMPFSLINTPGHMMSSLSPAINEISPGWVLAHCVFTVLRNEHKFRTRNKSKRTQVEPEIFRPEVINYMKDARAQLVAAAGKATLKLDNGEAVYTDKQVKGIGKNYMREKPRQEGVAAYTFFIQLYALGGLLELLEGGHGVVNATVQAFGRATHQLNTLVEEFGDAVQVSDCLRELVQKRTALANRAEQGKARDDARGKRIIPDYELVHKNASEETVVLQAQRDAQEIRDRVAVFLAKL